MSKDPTDVALWIEQCIHDEAPTISKMLLLGVRNDGSSFSFDTGLTADEAKEMAFQFIGWVQDCLRAAEKTRVSS